MGEPHNLGRRATNSRAEGGVRVDSEDSGMSTAKRTCGILDWVLMLGAFTALAAVALGGSYLYRALAGERSTFSIVAVDPVTGDVGVAGASCVPISAAAMTALVPGKGAAVTQAAYAPGNHSQVYELLRRGSTAGGIVEHMTDESYDSNVGIRQYGAVTLNQEVVDVTGFTGQRNNDWAGDQEDTSMAVSVQGNTLEDAAVVRDGLAAFSTRDIGPVELPDRLLRALEAASAAGGDRRCNGVDTQQTAQAAFIAVAKAGQPPFAAILGRDPSPNDPNRPWLFISVIEGKGGPNPLLDLRMRYDAWRSESMAPCADCKLDSIPVPAGGEPKSLSKALLRIVSRVGLVGVGLGCLSAFALVVALSAISYMRRRKRRSSA